MDCADIREGFLTGGVPSGPLAEEHANGCPECGELFANEAALGRRLASVARVEPDAGNLARVEATIERERGIRAFLRSRSTRMRWVLSLSLPGLLLLRELGRKRVPWRSLPLPRVIAGLVLVGLLAVVLRSALAPLPIARRAARLRSALAFGAWCLPWLLWLVPEAQANGDEWTQGFALRSFSCFAYGSALSIPSFALLWALDRHDRLPFRVGALGAGVVALVASSILIFHCPVTSRAHLALGHFSVGLACFLAVSVGHWRRRRV